MVAVSVAAPAPAAAPFQGRAGRGLGSEEDVPAADRAREDTPTDGVKGIKRT